jgi:hypothetical protein
MRILEILAQVVAPNNLRLRVVSGTVVKVIDLELVDTFGVL